MSDESALPGADSAPNAPGADLAATPPPAVAASAQTAGGYTYEVVDDGMPAANATAAHVPRQRSGAPWWLLVAAAVVPAALAGAAVWFIFGRGGNDASEAFAVTSTGVLNAFTSGAEGTTTTRYEGSAPPGYPGDIPSYEGAEIAGSVLQVTGEDAGYIVVADTSDPRDDVAGEMKAAFDADPWQIDVGQDSRTSTLYQFSKVDDANVTGIVLLTESKDGSRTTILTSIQVVGGAADVEAEPFTLAPGREVPEGFPEEVAAYDGSTVIEAAYQESAQGTSYAVSYVTADGVNAVADFYREQLEDAGLTVEDGDASVAPEGAEVLRFSNEDLSLQGDIVVYEFEEDDAYTRIDVQVGDER